MILAQQTDFHDAETSIEALAPVAGNGRDIIQRSLQAARKHLNLEVAYLSEFDGDETVFRHVDAPGLEALIKPGDRKSLDDVYCRHIVEGRLPELIPDTAAEPLAVAMPITAAVPIGAHVSVPIRLANGKLFGMFCCLGPSPDASLNSRDINVMRCFAELAAMEVEKEQKVSASLELRRQQIAIILGQELIDIVYQPIWDTRTRSAMGFESLSRFRTEEQRRPDEWFAEANALGTGIELECLAIRKALEGFCRLPHNCYLTINCSPSTVTSETLANALNGQPMQRVVIELTEHQKLEDVPALTTALRRYRNAGARIAIDDAGSGYSGLQQILELEPDIIKLDRFFVRSIELDASKRAMAAALATFARAVDSAIIAEGVETVEELGTLNALGFKHVQGYLLGKPTQLEHLTFSY